MRKELLLAAVLCGCGPGVRPEASAPTPSTSDDALTSPCGSDRNPDRSLLTGATASEAFVVRGDGSKTVLLTLGDPATHWFAPPVTRGGFIAVSTTALIDNRYVGRVALFDAEGRALATLENASGGVVSELGVVAASGVDGDLVLASASVTRSKAGLTLAGAFGPGGLLPVWQTDASATRTLALYDFESDAVVELPAPMSGWGSPVWSGDRLVYLSADGEQLRLVRFGGGETRVTPLVGATTLNGMRVEAVAGGKAVLVAGAWVQTRSTVDLETGAVTPLEVTLPAQAAWVGRHSPTLADDGSLVAAFSKDGAAGLYQSADGQAWASLGAPISGVSWLQFAGRGGSWLLTTGGMLPGAPDTVALRPALDRRLALPSLAGSQVPDASALSADGRCAAVWHANDNGFALMIANLEDGTTREVLTMAGQSVPMNTAWISKR